MKQKQGQSVDECLTSLQLMIPECNYHKDAPDDLLKDQFIFGITVQDIQNSLLSKIDSDDSIGKCFLEARKVKSQIKERKLLGMKTNVSYDAIKTYRKNKRYRTRSKNKGHGKGHGHECGHSQHRNIGDCKFGGSKHPPRKCPTYGQQCTKCNGKNHFG